MVRWRKWTAMTAATIIVNSLAYGQVKKPSQRAQSSPAIVACGAGVTVRLAPARPVQGSLALIDVQSKTPLTTVKADWGGREVAFWNEPSDARRASNQPDHWRGLLGVDLDKAVGPQELTVFVTKPSSDAVGCGARVVVREGRYPTERLKVEHQFVEPNEEQAARAKEEQAKLRAVFDTVTPDRLWTGKFRMPLDGVTSGGNFGRRRVLNGKAGSPHGGLDFPALTGTPVHASQAGKVAIAESMFFSGNTVVVDHGLGIYTFYCHLSEIGVKVGDAVESGSLLVNHARVNAMQIVDVFGKSR